jgi:hypothetical protein
MRFVLLAFLLAFFPVLARGAIVASSGDVEIIDPPEDVTTGELEHNSIIYTFVERQEFTLSTKLPLDINLAGTSPDNGKTI